MKVNVFSNGKFIGVKDVPVMVVGTGDPLKEPPTAEPQKVYFSGAPDFENWDKLMDPPEEPEQPQKEIKK